MARMSCNQVEGYTGMRCGMNVGILQFSDMTAGGR